MPEIFIDGRALQARDDQTVMEVARERARERSPAQVLSQYRRDGFVQPAPVDDLRAALSSTGGVVLQPATAQSRHKAASLVTAFLLTYPEVIMAHRLA